MDDSQNETDGNRGVGSVAALTEDLDPGVGRKLVDARNDRFAEACGLADSRALAAEPASALRDLLRENARSQERRDEYGSQKSHLARF
jgi:hypothetical protein